MNLNLRFVVSRPFGLLKTAQLATLLTTWLIRRNMPYRDSGISYVLFGVLLLTALSYIAHLFDIPNKKKCVCEDEKGAVVIPFAAFDFFLAIFACCLLTFFFVTTFLHRFVNVNSYRLDHAWELLLYAATFAPFAWFALLVYKKAVNSNDGKMHDLVLQDEPDIPASLPSYIPHAIPNEFGIQVEKSSRTQYDNQNVKGGEFGN